MSEKIIEGFKKLTPTLFHKHTCLFYKSKDEMFEVLVPFFKEGLENNEFCLWAASEPSEINNIKTALGKAVENLDRYIEKGQLEIGDYKNYYLKTEVFVSFEALEFWVKKEKEILEQGFNGMRVTGDGTWALEDHWLNFSYYEEEIDRVISKKRMRSICTYFLDKLELRKLLKLGKHHQSVLIKRNGQWDIIDPANFIKPELQL
ncbi:MAG: MEDS domain-containing protein [Candidatus Omnitrophota bacterium]